MTTPRAAAWRKVQVGVLLIGTVFYLNAQSYVGRVDLHDYQVQACGRGLLDRAGSVAKARRDATFKRDAAAARQKDGNLATAAKYRANADLDDQYALSQSERLLGGDLATLLDVDAHGQPAPRAVAEARRACEDVNPAPSPFRVVG